MNRMLAILLASFVLAVAVGAGVQLKRQHDLEQRTMLAVRILGTLRTP